MPAIDTILEQVQIDHTVIDVTVVDERLRRPHRRDTPVLRQERLRCRYALAGS